MYEFIIQEDFWMDVAVIVALIGLGGTIGGTVIGGVITRSSRLEKIKDGVQGLITGQEGIASRHNTLTLDHQKILGAQDNMKEHILKGQMDMRLSLNETKSAVNSINNMLIEKKVNDENIYKNMDEKQKIMVDSMKNLTQFMDEMKKMSEENHELKETLKMVSFQYQTLEVENKMLKEKLNYRYPSKEPDMDMER